jgi:hypothetical protein
LVPLDGSNHAEQAIEAATALARLLEVKVGGYQVNVSDQRVDWSVV